jgi:hypothetical protein
LIVGGTPAFDDIDIRLRGGSLVVQIVSIGSQRLPPWKFDAAKISRIEVYGQGGNDQIRIDPAVILPVVLLAGHGHAVFSAGGGPSIAVFADGGEVRRHTGRNIVVGLMAGGVRDASPDELLISRPFDFEADVGSLRAILTEWIRPNLTRRERLEHLTGKLPGGNNGAAIIRKDAIFPPLR